MFDSFAFRTGGIPARAVNGQKLLLYVGIIDILQSYHIRKRLEHTFKSVLTDGVSERKKKKKRIDILNEIFRLKSPLPIQVFIPKDFKNFSLQLCSKKHHVNTKILFSSLSPSLFVE